MIRAALVFFAAAASVGAAPPAPSAAFFRAHREKFLSGLPAGAIAVLRAASEDPDGRVTGDPYRQDSDFWYLTGFPEPEAIAVMIAGAAGRESRYLLFVRPRDFALEQWTGWRAGVEGARKDYGAGEAYPVGEFWEHFRRLAATAPTLYYETGGDEEFGSKLLGNWNAGAGGAAGVRPAAQATPVIAAMRLVKDALEQDLLREASRLSAQAHRAAMGRVAPGRSEHELKAAMVGLCLQGGAARMAYPPIVGSGRNSVILHYERDDEKLDDGEMIVNDTGCEYGMYAADVTRSYPVSGHFSAEQRQVYDIVLAAQKAGLEKVRPGVPFHEVHDATVGVVVDGLLRLGILSGKRDQILATRAYQKFYPHGSSHWIGLDVHDAGSYGYPSGVERLERYGKAQTRLAPGMALTVEPGIYIPERSTADPKWWNLGVRIEDTVLVTAEGPECLSCGAPREAADVEKAIAEGRTRKEP